MTNSADISEHFFNYLQSDVDTSVGLGLTDKLAQLGDPSLTAHQQSVAVAEALLAKVNAASSAGNFYELLDIDLIKLYLQQD